MVRMKALAERKVSADTTEAYFRRVLTYLTVGSSERAEISVNEGAIRCVQKLVAGGAREPICPLHPVLSLPP